jgi:hypothetical protein
MRRQWSVGWDSVATDGTDWHDALQQVQLAGKIAKRVADLGLHRFDMAFCERILKEYSHRLVGEYDDLSQALLIAVFTKFISCFRSSKARGCLLKESKVYGSSPTALQAFYWILNLRNKHVVHDVNSYYGAAAFAWLDEQDGNVRQVGVMTYVTRIDPALVDALRYLVNRAQEHIRIAIADAGKALLAEVQMMSPEARAALEKIRIALPTDPYADLTDIRQSAT